MHISSSTLLELQDPPHDSFQIEFVMLTSSSLIDHHVFSYYLITLYLHSNLFLNLLFRIQLLYFTMSCHAPDNNPDMQAKNQILSKKIGKPSL